MNKSIVDVVIELQRAPLSNPERSGEEQQTAQCITMDTEEISGLSEVITKRKLAPVA